MLRRSMDLAGTDSETAASPCSAIQVPVSPGRFCRGSDSQIEPPNPVAPFESGGSRNPIKIGVGDGSYHGCPRFSSRRCADGRALCRLSTASREARPGNFAGMIRKSSRSSHGRARGSLPSPLCPPKCHSSDGIEGRLPLRADRKPVRQAASRRSPEPSRCGHDTSNQSPIVAARYSDRRDKPRPPGF